MTPDDFNKLPDDLREYRFRKSLGELSATDARPDGSREYCIALDSAICHLLAIDFDSVKEYWRKDRLVFMGKSADALLVDGEDWYLIEFKTGGINVAESLRKVYDSAMALVEFGILTWEQCKSRLTFILVGKEVETRLEQLRKKSRSEYMDLAYKAVDLDPRTVEGQIVKEFLIYTPSEFETLAVAHQWRN